MNQNNFSGNYRIKNKNAIAGKYFQNKTKVIGSTPVDNSKLDMLVKTGRRGIS